MRELGLMGRGLAVAAGVVLASAGAANAAVNPAPDVNPAPNVVPAIREWSGGSGALVLDEDSRIVVAAASLSDEATSLRDDLSAVTGLRLPVVRGSRPHDSDVLLALGSGPSEGYTLDVGERDVELRGDEAGVFYGTQTLLQMVRTRGSLPRGVARDWPAFRERGYLLDAGRKYYSPDFIVQTIREMSYLHLNTLQLHLSDNNAFRLVSDHHPELAAPDAYTKADIRRFEAAAHQYHVSIVPEIEMPAHAAAILKAHPEFGFDCQSMAGSTLDVTKPAVRQFTKSLIDEFAPLFGGPTFHIATDEYPTQDAQSHCPELADYARAHGLGSSSDVFVDFINEMNRAVRGYGQQMVIWNWWDVDQQPTINPDTNIKVEAWTTAAETDEDHSPQKYLGMGYEVVVSPSDTLYVTQGFPLLPDPKFLYEQWQPLADPRLTGYQISVWSDNAITRPINSFDAYLRRPREVLADRTWGGPRQGTVADFFARADAIGTPPDVPEYALPNTLRGTPYGTSPGYEPTSTFDKAFDGDPITYFLFAEPSGGHAGVDLGPGRASTVSLIRFYATPGEQNIDRLVGGRFEGCTAGPTAGCHTLATVSTRPDFGWNELVVNDTGSYRWLRYVGPDGGYSSVAEIEFVAPDSAVTVQAPAKLRQLADNRVSVRYRNTTGRALHDVRLDLSAYSTQDRTKRAARAAGDTTFRTVSPGKTVTATWRVDVPLSAATGGYDLVGRATARDGDEAGGFTRATLDPALETTLDPDVVGLNAGDSATTRLRVVNHAARAVTVTWQVNRTPSDNLSYSLTPATGTLTVQAGGSSTATLTASAAPDTTGAATPIRVDLSRAAGEDTARAGAVELNVLGYAGAKSSLAATYNSPGISDDNNPAAGNFDGGGFSYSAQGLATQGLSRGATVHQDGLTFTWPDVAPGQPSNTIVGGQVIAFPGQGSKLGFLGAAAFGTQSGSLFVTYTDGSIQRAQLTFADWFNNDPAPGGAIVATAPWNVPPDNPFEPGHLVSVYYTAIAIDPSKTVRFVTLPSNENLHVFDMAIGGTA